jgi:hypothetical protein
MNWGKWIIVAFLLFTGFIATLVTVCMRQNVDLVSKDYYNEELAYQEQILRLNNANQLAQKPEIQKNGAFLSVSFDELSEIKNGKLKLFNPSDPKKDKAYIIESSRETRQLIPIDDIAKGMYRAQMQWSLNGKEYFIETIINI